MTETILTAIAIGSDLERIHRWMSPHLRPSAPGEPASCILITTGAEPYEVEKVAGESGDPWRVLVAEPRDAAAFGGDVDLVMAPAAPAAELAKVVGAPRNAIHIDVEPLALLSLLTVSKPAAERTLAAACGVQRASFQLVGQDDIAPFQQTLVADELAVLNPDLARTLHIGAPYLLASGRWLFALPMRRGEQHDFPRIALIADAIVALGPRDRSLLAGLACRLCLEMEADDLASSLAREVDSLRQSPGVDPQLGLWNARAVEELLEGQLAGAARGHPAPTVGVIDLVDLAGVNKRHGHKTGDNVLRRAGATIKRGLRTEDIVGRLGGDEFVILFTATPASAAEGVLERLVASVGKMEIDTPAGPLQVGASAGLSEIEAGDSATQVIARARSAASKAQEQSLSVLTARERTTVPAGRARNELDEAPATLGGNYRLLHEISRGAMGVVYRGQDVALGRPVAVKMLRPDLVADAEFIQRFRIEATILAQLRHPNLVQIYSFGEERDETYFVMELVEGESVEEAMLRLGREGGKFELSRIRQVALDIGSALDALHARGIVHRDVKPANVVLAPFTNRAVLVDVGVAWRHGDAGQVAGTPGFIAPEAMARSEFGPRSDLYGLAATLYSMCALREPFPFDGEDFASLYHRQCEERPAPLADRDPALERVDRVLELALNPDPSHRHTSAGAFAHAFAGAVTSVLKDAGEAQAPRDDTATSTEPSSQHSGQVRAIVLRALPRVIGVREAERLRNDLVESRPALARALEPSVGALDWLRYETFEALLAQAAAVGSDRDTFARNLGRATVRMSFRRFFPVSAATLDPSGSLAAIDSIWKRYHDWGQLRAIPLGGRHVVVKLEGNRVGDGVMAWLAGMLEQVVVLSGGQDVALVLDHGQSSIDVTWSDKSPD